MKKILLLIFTFITALGVVSGSSFFTTYQLNFPNNQPTSIFIDGGECTSNSCSSINSNLVELYNANQVNSCWAQFNNDLTSFNSCIIPAKINGNIANLIGTSNQIVTKVTTPSNFGYITWFSTNGDSYLTMVDRSLNYACNFDTCLDTNVVNINFQKKSNAIATIGKLNIKNIDSSNLPVQINVPVSIDQTTCSAFKFTNSNWYRPNIPIGFSDFSVNTLISLNITKISDGSNLLSQSLTIPILADNCAKLGAFSWTAPSNLLNDKVKFEVTSDIIDNQIINPIKDFSQIIQTIYPTNLDNSCWVRGYDFTLANIPTQNLNPSISQITKISQLNFTESLFAQFNAGAFRDQNVTPMSFESIIKIDGNIISSNLFNSGINLQTYTMDLTNSISNLSVGSHLVKLTLKPVGTSCTTNSNIVLNQNLQILEANTYNVTFHIIDKNGNPLNSSLVNLNLLSLNGNFQSTTIYNNSIITNNLGIAKFTNILSGNYKYIVNKTNVGSRSSLVNITANSDFYIIINDVNVAPSINLPSQLKSYYNNPIIIDLRDYVNDENNAFDELNFNKNLISGNAIANINNGIITFTTNQVGISKFKINVFDPNGENASDSILINFTNNKPAIINTFNVNPNNGQVPFNAIFNIDINPVDGDNLICTLNFGDGSSTIVNGNCSSLNGLNHIYNISNSYTAKLEVNDNSNSIISAIQMIYVYNRTGPVPKINSFTLISSNGNVAPTNLMLNWNITHTLNWQTTCTLRYNSQDTNVNCIGSKNINNYNISGTSIFSIIAIDNASTQVVQSIPLTLMGQSYIIENTDLIMDNVIVPGKFKIKVGIKNELFNNRIIKLSPSIVCDGIVNNYKKNILDTTINSNVKLTNYSIYELTLNTNDFKLNVPTDINCEFKANIFDNLGFFTTKTQNVVFSYPVEKSGIKSIRGTGTDIINFMSSAILTPYLVGYNSLEFTITNNEDIGKKLSISFTVASLGINYQLDENLPIGSQRSVQIPIYIKQSVNPGKYPVRISVNDGINTQTKYTYILIK